MKYGPTHPLLLLAAASALLGVAALFAQAQPAPTAPATTQPLAASATPATGLNGKPIWGSVVIDPSKLVAKPSAIGSRKDVFSGPTSTLENFESHISTVNPGETSHPPHFHPNEELIVVMEGTMEVTINGKSQLAGPGCIIHYSTNDPHGLRNPGTVPATYYVFNWVTDKTPRPVITTPLSAVTTPKPATP